MGMGPRSQSLRATYGKLQEPWGRPLEGRLRRVLSLRQGREKSKSRGLEGGTEELDGPAQERLPGALGDTEQLIQAQRGSSRAWLRQYRQVRRKWDSFVASFPGVTLSRPASPE
uniref:Chromosome 11 open reading frame 86 n=1 Tax=Prolemur simus TaxID=1328070 RepID=A0A8C9B296_PROSS